MKFFIVDAFTTELFGGNPAGVVLVPEDGDFPSDETMRRTAAELRYSETAFVKRLGGDSFHTRYFTPAAEVDLCGHATIAAFHVLGEEGLIGTGAASDAPDASASGANGGPYTNRTLAGDLNVEIKDGVVRMDMAAPEYIRAIDAADELTELYAVMGLNSLEDRPGPGALSKAGVLRGESGLDSMNCFPEIISTGLPDIILPVATEERLNAIRPDFTSLAELSKRYEVTGVHAFCPSAAEYRCRNFAPLYGIDEEAATGTANAALTYYLYRHGGVAPGATNVFIQGEAMGRPSRVLTLLTAKEDDPSTSAHRNYYGNILMPESDREIALGAGKTNAVTIKAGGTAVTLASGDIRL
jgi:predicted PhzF superfamily epimerase YddE/YHI9